MAREIMEKVGLAARIALFLFSLSVGMVVLMAGTRAALAASLRTEGVVTGEYIRLGDVFDGVKNADYILGPAPAPGKDMILNASSLYRIASALNVSWTPASSAEQLVLRREATIITQSDVTAQIEKKISEEAVQGKFTTSFMTAPSDIVLPAGTDRTIDITAFRFHPHNDSFDAVLVAPSAENPLKRFNVSGRIERLVSIPVLSNTFKNGDIISARDLDWIDLPESKIANGTLRDEKDLINMTPRRTVFNGKPIISNELEHPRMVDRGQNITLIFENGPMVLTTKGKSLQAGAIGDVVRVSNTDSNRNLQGIVTGYQQVTVR